MDNRTRRDRGMAYFSDESVMNEQLKAKRAIRQYTACMPFDTKQGMTCLEEAGIVNKGVMYFEQPFHCEYGTHFELGEYFYAYAY